MLSQSLAFTFVFLLGLAALEPHRRDLGNPVTASAAFPTGLAIVIFEALILMVLKLPFSAFVLGSVYGATLVLLLARAFRAGGFRLDLRMLLAGAAVFIALAIGATSFNAAALSYDSHYFTIMGRSIATGGGFSEELWPYLGSWGVFAILVQAHGQLLGLNYFYALYPLLGCSAIALFASLGVRRLSWPSGDFRRALALTLGTALLVWSHHFLIFHLIYIHTNLSSALYLLMLAGGLISYAEERTNGWLTFAFVGALALSIQRIEGPLVTALFLVLAMVEIELPRSLLLRFLTTEVIAIGAWYGVLMLQIGSSSELMKPTHALFVIVALLGLLGAHFALRVEWVERRKSAIPIAILYVLALFVAASAFADAKHAGLSFLSLIYNLFTLNWGLLWSLVLGLALLSPRVVELKGGRIISFGVPAYVLLVLALGVFRTPYRPGWGDSANRMMIHVVPILFFFFLVKYGRALTHASHAGSPTPDRTEAPPGTPAATR